MPRPTKYKEEYCDLVMYNGRGELVYKEVDVGSETDWYEAYTRTLDGVVYKVSNHQGVESTYGLTASMKLRSVDMLLGGSNKSIISSAAYNAKGQLQDLNYHDGGAQTTLSYNAQTLQLERIQSSAATKLQDLTLTYNGNKTSQTHKSHTKGLKSDQLDTRRTATEFDFGDGKKIQDHPKGHTFSDGAKYDKQHINNHGEGGTSIHYEYEK